MPVAPELAILALRVAVVAALYLLLIAIALMARRGIAAPARAGGATPRRLVVVVGGSTALPAGTTVPLQPRTTIGRSADNAVVIPETVISGHHAAVILRGGQWWLEDLGSTNGTAVNGQIVRRPVVLGVGDDIAVGPVQLRVSA